MALDGAPVRVICPADDSGKFIRIYMAMQKKQLYISVSNATNESVRKIDKEYITNKRGNHGHGLKRIDLIVEKKQTGQPIIAICGSVEDSRDVSELLRNRQIEHVLLNAENSDEENEILEEAGRFNKVTITTALANRGVDIVIGGNPRTLISTPFVTL